MAERALFLSSRPFDRATLVASSAVSSLPVTYLQDVQPAKKWRATGCVAESIRIDLGTDRACTDLGLAGHNLTSAATLQVRAAATAADVTAAPAINTTVSAWPSSGKHTDEDWPQEISLVRWANGTAYRYWRLDIVDAANPVGYVQAGRLWLDGGFLQRIDLNVGLGLESPDAQARTPFARTYTDPRGDASRRLVLPLSAINDTDLKRSLFQLQRYCGLARDFAFSLDPTATTDFHIYTLQGLFTEGAQFEAQPLWDTAAQLWRTSLTITEPL